MVKGAEPNYDEKWRKKKEAFCSKMGLEMSFANEMQNRSTPQVPGITRRNWCHSAYANKLLL